MRTTRPAYQCYNPHHPSPSPSLCPLPTAWPVAPFDVLANILEPLIHVPRCPSASCRVPNARWYNANTPPAPEYSILTQRDGSQHSLGHTARAGRLHACPTPCYQIIIHKGKSSEIWTGRPFHCPCSCKLTTISEQCIPANSTSSSVLGKPRLFSWLRLL